jgi:hypothetical protein
MVQPTYRLLFLMLMLGSGHYLLAQQPVKPRLSPLAIASAKYKDSYIKITYGQPQKRGREVFGNLVPYNEVWRTGANEATEITLTRSVYMQGTLVPAGTYSLFSIPNPGHWTIILSKDTGLWGSYNYNPKMDFVRFAVPVASTDNPAYEAFTIMFEQRNNTADLLLLWDTTKIIIPIKFNEPKP